MRNELSSLYFLLSFYTRLAFRSFASFIIIIIIIIIVIIVRIGSSTFEVFFSFALKEGTSSRRQGSSYCEIFVV